ncbi:MAG: hypothetical protein QF878_05510 [SAR202 cluster bacterium]|jgi:hypothetical protein|nr:hypothetical protein [SAR202 cluster bacterium]MDP6713769.1 hypothetical protein [SAR202 cluster bacterium]|tara:strand:- start:212 stop:571 length:360 start_codon:yes stop_codon:yes gene_type:complete
MMPEIHIDDMVMFRLGERPNTICPFCDAQSFGSEWEAWMVRQSGKVFQVVEYEYGLMPCCGLQVPYEGLICLAYDDELPPVVDLGLGFLAYSRELTPVASHKAPEIDELNDRVDPVIEN